MKDFKVAVQDLILVSVDKKVKDYSKTATDVFVAETYVPRGEVKELAILNKNKSRFILISEFEERNIRAVSKFVGINSVGEYDFEVPDIMVEPSPAAIFTLSKEEIEFGVDFSVLKQKNDDLVQNQVKLYIKRLQHEKTCLAKRKLLEESREEYLNF